MRIKIFLIIFLIVSAGTLMAGHDIVPGGGKSAAMSGASVTNRDLWSAFNNQAGLADVRHIAAGLIYENKFLLKELSTKAGAFALPVNKGTFALSFYQYGFNLYNENKVGLAYAMPLSERFSAAVQLDYLLTQLAENYGRKGLFTFEVGLLAKINHKWYMGAQIYNPARVKLTSDVEERIPSYIRFGTNYMFNENVNLVVEAEKDLQNKPMFRAGIDYQMVKNVYVRAGAGTNPSVFSFGFGVNMKNFKVDFGTSKHTVLGYSPALSLMYSFE
ncbi:MAG: hypothetical protein BWY70_01695 [Bacteroidetes bacterium ADurb.Bin408]|nr:MAG: hypothetical protein BWY70_01695 [Bacteroidetes bacterium ADurb.Bin408]